ncbi:MAG: Crp/Fnr family transcriptional regulator [Novosphingobium sp.]|uniref:Crp/Fnr family transcriptional regulator n=1 Tax=Novosphingobium sp. TaxID=1874826 RepID=UPI000BC5FF77|nr:Crp/Fnr family transcriptional regulator [Novosphingobium sp.]MDP3551951.1 Crp/Fnr family transcriptional regulator [Novosphingobium sp.]OYZ89957.1 MAG: Crp/Fnr family transcriptional regulator [Sphingomonadales bacterium 17-56-6]
MANAFTKRLSGYAPLNDADVGLLADACRNVRDVPAGHHLIMEGDSPDPVFVMLEGWACGYKILPDGGRQILAFMLPGDFCDIHIAVLKAVDHSIVTITNAKVASVPRAQMEVLVQARPTITRAFWWSQLVDQSVLRAWIVSMGRRTANERIAHLMCELYIRMRNIGLATDDQCEMPLTQIVIADAVGLTPVHVNRVLKSLRLGKVMELRSGSLTIIDPVRLSEIAGFDGNYLHGRLKQVG